jgi:hypothetical protein
LESVRPVLKRQIAFTKNPQHFYVADWPINRGARELFIARNNNALPQFVWLGDTARSEVTICDEGAILVVAANGILIDSQHSLIEVTRLMELHTTVGAVGGLVERKDGLVVDACYMVNGAGKLESPWLGHLSNYCGAYALAQKTQSVATTGKSLAFFRISALKRVGAWPLSDYDDISDLVMKLCGQLAAAEWIVAFSPLVKAKAGSSFRIQQSRKRIPYGVPIMNHMLIRYGSGLEFRD